MTHVEIVSDLSVTDAQEALEPDDAALFDAAVLSEADLPGALEAILLIVDAPVSEAALAAATGHPVSRIAQQLHRLADGYAAGRSGIELRQVDPGWRFYTRDRYAGVVERFVLDGRQARLSKVALETLAVVAYRQPVTRTRIAAVRGVNADGVVRTLTARGLIAEAGLDPDTGGQQFVTTALFLDRLGIAGVDELPSLGPLLPDVDGFDDDR